MPRRVSLTLLAVGLVLLLGSPLVWWLSQPAPSVGEVPPAAAAAEPAPAEPGEFDGPATSTDDRHRALGTDADVDRGLVPTRLEVPSLGVDAPVEAVGLDPDGGMELPDDVARVGWYEPGVAVGEPGTAVLAGHVDSRTQGPGALFELGSLEVGDEVVVGDGDDDSTWRVTGRARYPKDELPLDEIFRWEGEPTLALITCGGEFSASAGSYHDNVVVYAEPA